jgi:hypothetical protein
MKDTATSLAFAKAGIRSPRERLEQIADEAFAEHPRTLDAARALVLRAVMNDAALLWVMFERWHGPAADMLIQQAAARKREKSEAIHGAKSTHVPPPHFGALRETNAQMPTPQRASSQSTGPSLAAREAARMSVARVISKLDTFKINGKPIGDCTPEEAMGWRATKVREARFIYLMCSGLPPGRPIRDFIRPQESEEFYSRAMTETANE